MPGMVCCECKTPIWASRWSANRDVGRSIKKAMIALLPEHQPLPAWKHSGSKRERFVAVSCEIQRKGYLRQGAASHGKREGFRNGAASAVILPRRACGNRQERLGASPRAATGPAGY